MTVEEEVIKLQRYSRQEGVYTLVMVVGILVAAALIPWIGAWVFVVVGALFVPKFWLAGRWQRQLDLVMELSHAARGVAERRGFA